MFNVVYDCGSETSNSRLNDEIDKTFPRGSFIDILFISHFDSDHINGVDSLIKRCKLNKDSAPIRLLVLPLLNNCQKVMVFLETGIGNFENNALKERFNAQKIIFVKPISERFSEPRISYPESQNNSEDSHPKYRSTPIDHIKDEIESGEGIDMVNNIDWIYIPFNVCDNDIYRKFCEFAGKENQKIYDCLRSVFEKENHDDISNMFDEKIWNTIQDLYKKFHEQKSVNKNQTSLIVYSGSCVALKDSKNFLVQKHRFIRSKVAALFTGDVNLTAKIGDDSSTKTTVLQHIGKVLSPVIYNVGLIQVPHHGSKYNFDPDLVNVFQRTSYYFISYGINNHHKHPYPGIKIFLKGENKTVIEITENEDSELTQTIRIIDFN